MPDFHYIVNGPGFHIGNTMKSAPDILTDAEVEHIMQPDMAHLQNRVVRVAVGALPEHLVPAAPEANAQPQTPVGAVASQVVPPSQVTPQVVPPTASVATAAPAAPLPPKQEPPKP